MTARPTLVIAAVFAQILFSSDGVLAQQTSSPVEVGDVRWSRDFDATLSASRKSRKPVLVLFQEVPGCAGCQEFGRKVLSEPLLFEAIEDLFEPVLVHNNKGGKDAEILKKYNEPAWNYQVLRFLDADGKDILPRKDQIASVEGVASRLIQALEKVDRRVPKYLTTLAVPTSGKQRSTAAFSQYCFWTGEFRLGKIDGVIETEAGFLDGREVTLVHYDNEKVSLEALAKQAAKAKCAEKVYTAEGKSLAGLPGGKLDASYRAAPASDQKRQVQRWKALKTVPGLNGTQLTKINSLAPSNFSEALMWLSPRQLDLLRKSNAKK
ncbi:MAG: VPGUxxT family thioredoxin-like (seleno)protein, type 2 [Planctomycetota bacterium]